MSRFLLALLVLPGCATIGTFQRAETLGQGNWEVGIEPSMWGGAGGGGAVAYPHAAVSARVGATDRVDLGGRLGSTGVEVSSKFLLSDPESDHPISLGANVGGFAVGAGGASAGLLAVHIPLLIGIPMGERGQFIVGPKTHIYHGFASSTEGSAGFTLWSVGASAGYAAPVGETFKVVPEVAFVVPAVASAGGESESVYSNGLLFQAGVGFVFGSR